MAPPTPSFIMWLKCNPLTYLTKGWPMHWREKLTIILPDHIYIYMCIWYPIYINIYIYIVTILHTEKTRTFFFFKIFVPTSWHTSTRKIKKPTSNTKLCNGFQFSLSFLRFWFFYIWDIVFENTTRSWNPGFLQIFIFVCVYAAETSIELHFFLSAWLLAGVLSLKILSWGKCPP